MSRQRSRVEAPTEVTDFGGLRIRWDRRVRRPRAWTTQQSRLAADIAESCPPGPILELCCGSGQIGLLAAGYTGRDLVQVDSDPVAAWYARENAAAAGIRSDVRAHSVASALASGELFPLVIADPPWLPASPDLFDEGENPTSTVSEGSEASVAIDACLDAALAHLSPLGHVLMQVGLLRQVEQLADRLADGSDDGRNGETGHEVLGVLDCRPGGLLVHIGPVSRARPGTSVSEVGGFEGGGAGEVVFPSDAVAGYPLGEDEGGHGIQEGAAGPNTPPRDDGRGRRDRESGGR